MTSPTPSTSNSGISIFDMLPPELLTSIFRHCSHVDLLRHERVCKTWQALARSVLVSVSPTSCAPRITPLAHLHMQAIWLTSRRDVPALLRYLSEHVELAPLVCVLRVDRGLEISCSCGVSHSFSPGSWLLEQAEVERPLTPRDSSKKCEVAQEAQAMSSLLQLTPNLRRLRWSFLPLDFEVGLLDSIGKLRGFRELQMTSALTLLTPDALWYDFLMVTNLMASMEQTGISCVRLECLDLRQPVHLPASVHTLGLKDCDNESASPWTGPGIRSLSFTMFRPSNSPQLLEKFATLAPQIECLEVKTLPPLQEKHFVRSGRLRSFYSHFYSVKTLKLEGALSLPIYLDPLPPVLQCLECRWPSIKPGELAVLVRKKEDLSPSLQRIVWISENRSQQSDFDAQDQELSVGHCDLRRLLSRSLSDFYLLPQKICRERNIELVTSCRSAASPML